MAYKRYYSDQKKDAPYSSRPEKFVPSSKKVDIALKTAKKAHEGQFRKTGEPFYYHPVEVAQILISWGLGKDEGLIAAAILHDTVEDANVSLGYISRLFGKRVSSLVDGVTKVGGKGTISADENTIKKVFKRSYLEPEVALIKLADRLHNMRTLSGLKPEKQSEKAFETLQIYTKLAESLGLWVVKKELEDLSFRYLEPELFFLTKNEIDEDPRLQENFIVYMVSSLEALMKEKKIEGKVITRLNGYWALHKKREKALLKGKTTLDRGYLDVNDMISFRVVTKDINDCYRAVGYIHERFGEYVDFERYDEFIGVNKRINGYSAIQTTLDLPQGSVEVAFATKKMESFNKNGVASLLESGENNLENYVLKSVFTSDGGVIYLPKKATGVDFAYSMSHSLGANADYITVNRVKKPLTTVIPNASNVEVVTGASRRAPSASLLNYCLPATRAIIVSQLNLAGTDNLMLIGKIKTEEVLAKIGLLRLEDLGPVAQELVFDYAKEDLKDIYLMLGKGAITSDSLAKWLHEHGLTKKSLGFTSIKITGADRSGILLDVSGWILRNGGNIVGIDLRTENKVFELLIVVSGLESFGEEKVSKMLSKDKRFMKWVLV